MTLLTIAIPTYNRAVHLERQLEWLTRARIGLEAATEVIVSDNCSTDETPAVVRRWYERWGDDHVRVNRNGRNLGAVGNVAHCIRSATGQHVWVVGDDDRIDDDALRYVLARTTADPQLALLVLNFSSRDVVAGRTLFGRCFELDVADGTARHGASLFERCLSLRRTERWGGLALTTALVYRTDLARRSLEVWPGGTENITVQLYISGFCAANGKAAVTADTYLECNASGHYFSDDTKLLFGFWSAQMAEAFVKLAELGYSPNLCRRKVLERPFSFLRLLPRCLPRWPRYTTAMLRRYVRALLHVQRLVRPDPRAVNDARHSRR